MSNIKFATDWIDTENWLKVDCVVFERPYLSKGCLTGRVAMATTYILFERESDAVMYKLRLK